jgi:transposase
MFVKDFRMGLSGDARDELRSRLYSDVYDRSVAWRAQIVPWDDEGYPAAQIAQMARTTKPTVYKWIERYAECGITGLESRQSTGRPRSISGEARSRILALSRESPPESTGLTHWSSSEMARYLERHEEISVSHNFVSALWREHGLQPVGAELVIHLMRAGSIRGSVLRADRGVGCGVGKVTQGVGAAGAALLGAVFGVAGGW